MGAVTENTMPMDFSAELAELKVYAGDSRGNRKFLTAAAVGVAVMTLATARIWAEMSGLVLAIGGIAASALVLLALSADS